MIDSGIGFARKCLKVVRNPILSKTKITYEINRILDDHRAKQGYFPYPHKIIFLAGLPLGGTTWMKNLLAYIPGYYTRPTPMPWEVQYEQNICDSAFGHTPEHGYSLFKTHLNPTTENLECLTRNGVSKILVTYRDFRDAALSYGHRLMKYPKPREAQDYIDYQKMGINASLELIIENIDEHFVSWIRGWMNIAQDNPTRFHFVKFEELKNDTKKAYKEVLDFYEIDLPEKLIDENIIKAHGRKTVAKNFKEADILPWGLSSNFRSGNVGGWRNEFTARHINLAKEKMGQALIDFGYEKNLDWESEN
jgi:hypothetical protein